VEFSRKSLARSQLFLRNQSDPQSETHQARNIMNVQAAHQFHAVVFDGLGTDFQDFGDALGVLAFGNQLENLALIVHGEQDDIFPASDARKLAGLFGFEWRAGGFDHSIKSGTFV
jgi:hypothetical protein